MSNLSGPVAPLLSAQVERRPTKPCPTASPKRSLFLFGCVCKRRAKRKRSSGALISANGFPRARPIEPLFHKRAQAAAETSARQTETLAVCIEVGQGERRRAAAVTTLTRPPRAHARQRRVSPSRDKGAAWAEAPLPSH
eukprot:scaffold318486_cov32-Tisochrysis_lutea.AAC.2